MVQNIKLNSPGSPIIAVLTAILKHMKKGGVLLKKCEYSLPWYSIAHFTLADLTKTLALKQVTKLSGINSLDTHCKT